MCVIKYIPKCTPYCILESTQLNSSRHTNQKRMQSIPADRIAVAGACSPVPKACIVGPEAQAKEQDGLCTLCLCLLQRQLLDISRPTPVPSRSQRKEAIDFSCCLGAQWYQLSGGEN